MIPYFLYKCKKIDKKMSLFRDPFFYFECRLFRNRFGFFFSSVEFVDRARLKDAFFSSIKRVTFVTGLDFDLASNSTSGCKGISARTSNNSLSRKLWMNVFFHKNRKQ